MQQKHKRHHHPRPVVPIHGALSRPGAGRQQQQTQTNAQKDRKQQQQHKQQQRSAPADGKKQQQQQHKQQQRNATADAKQQQQQQQQQAPAKPLKGLEPSKKKQKVHHHTTQAPVQDGGQPQQQPQQQQQPKQEHPRQQQQQHKKQRLPKQQRQQPGAQPNKDKAMAQQQQQQLSKSSRKRKRGAQPANNVLDAAAAAAAADSNPAAAVAAASAAAGSGLHMQQKPWHPNSTAAVSSNWQALQQQLKAAKEAAAASGQHKPFRRKRKEGAEDPPGGGSSSKAAKRQIGSIGRNTALTPVVAMDCEMVGVGPNGDRDSLARVSIVNAAGNVLLDTFVAQKEAVVDFRTWVSGVTPQHLLGAPSLEEVQKQVCELLSGRVVVGHSLNKDLKVLLLSHPRKDVRDTARYPPFMFSKGGKRRPKALKQLSQQELGLTIQEGQHSSVDDARAALYLYQKHAAEWERALKTPGGIKQLPTSNQAARKKRVESYAAKAITDDHMADL